MPKDQFHPHLMDLEVMDFLSVFDHLDDGVVIADIKGVILFYNQAQGKIDDIKPETAMGKKVTEIYELNSRNSMMMQALYHQTAFQNQIFFYRTLSGKVANTITSVYPLYHQGKIRGVVCFAKDYERLKNSAPTTLANEVRSERGNGTQYTFNDIIGSGADFVRVKIAAQKAAASPIPHHDPGRNRDGQGIIRPGHPQPRPPVP